MILVVGSTGSLGTSVVTGLLAAGKSVAALVRDSAADRARQLQSAGATLVVGDLKAAPTLHAALRGIDTVVCTASSTLSRQAGDSIETVDHKGTLDLIDAASSAKVRRFVFISFSRNIRDDFPLAVAKRSAERRLKSSRIDFTILLPSYFAETWFSAAVGFDISGGQIRLYGDGTSKVSYVAREDVARATIACLDNPAASGKSIPIGGPRPISQLDAVALAEHATGTKLQVEFMTREQIVAVRKLAHDSLTQSFLGLFESLSQGDEIPGGWDELLGIKPQSMEDWFTRLAARTSNARA